MPRFVALVLAVVGTTALGGCFFDADYSAGGYRCSDGRCPSGLTCNADDRCVVPADAAPEDADAPPDVPPDVPIDAPPAALTCVDPGVLPAAGGTAMGTTVGRSSTISSSCGGLVMNGPDAVYRITAGAGDQYLVSITGLKAYVLQPCSVSPATPICVGNMHATAGNPISVTATAAGQYFVIVDHENAATSGPYTLTVTKQ